MARRDPKDRSRTSRERRRQGVRERVEQTFGNAGQDLPPRDRTSTVLESIVAFVLGTGFWRLVVSDSWATSAVFGVLLAALLFSYGLFRSRWEEKAGERTDDRPPRDRGPRG